jgi:hypothetical protein
VHSNLLDRVLLPIKDARAPQPFPSRDPKNAAITWSRPAPFAVVPPDHPYGFVDPGAGFRQIEFASTR